MASCALHPEFPATSRCTRCGKAICAACERSLDGKPYCAECETELARKLAAGQATMAPLAPMPPMPPIPPAGLLRPLAFALAAMLTTFNEVDMGAVMDLRKQYKEEF